MRRSSRRALQGCAAGAGAPLGWLLIRLAGGATPGPELADHSLLYLYMLVGTAGAFGLFGAVMGRREEALEATNRMLDELAVSDPLTGLRNVRYFWQRLGEAHAAARRGEHSLSLVLLDLDHFKRVNDRHGHPTGDRVLAGVADALREVTRRGETAARVGGEEFALILPESDAAAGREAAERVRAAIAAREVRSREGADPIRVTASAGVAGTDRLPAAGPRTLYAEADRALLRAKEGGRNRVVVAAARTDPGAR